MSLFITTGIYDVYLSVSYNSLVLPLLDHLRESRV